MPVACHTAPGTGRPFWIAEAAALCAGDGDAVSTALSVTVRLYIPCWVGTSNDGDEEALAAVIEA
jgi:hypothetical protein